MTTENPNANQHVKDEPRTLETEPLALARSDELLNPLEIDGTAVKRLRDKLQAQEDMMRLVLSRQHSTDWTDHDGRPYLGGDAGKRYLNAFGVYFVDRKVEPGQDDEGDYYVVTASARCGELVLGQYSGIRRCGRYERESGNGAGKWKGAGYASDPVDAQRAAFKNLYSNAARDILGLGGMTWEDLARYGIRRELAGRVQYREGGHGGKTAGNPSDDASITAATFGDKKGIPWTELPDKDLQFFQNSAETSLANPDKAKWHGQQRRVLAGIAAERARRAAAQPPAPPQPDGAPESVDPPMPRLTKDAGR